jgi:hypothetical protein
MPCSVKEFFEDCPTKAEHLEGKIHEFLAQQSGSQNTGTSSPETAKMPLKPSFYFSVEFKGNPTWMACGQTSTLSTPTWRQGS